MRLASPWSLVLLALVALGLLFLLPRTRRAGRRAAVRYPTLATLRAVAPAGAAHRRAILGVLRVAALVLLVLALARPQAGSATTKLHREGVDVVLAVDLSGSMLAEDLKPNRMEAAKDAAKDNPLKKTLFDQTDLIRKRLGELGVTLEDRPGGTTWRVG